MKNVLIIWVGICLLVLVSLVSCNKIETTKVQDFNPIKLHDLQNFSEPIQNIIFKNLTPEEKYNLWKEKITQVIFQNLGTEQKRLALEVNKILDVALFTEGNTKHQDIINKFADEWTKRALEHFPNGQLRHYFGSLENLNPSPFDHFSNDKIPHPRIQQILDNSMNELTDKCFTYCNCRWGWWCDSRCVSEDCARSGGRYYGGCGFLLLQDCESMCK